MRVFFANDYYYVDHEYSGGKGNKIRGEINNVTESMIYVSSPSE